MSGPLDLSAFDGRRVLITGGLGFIGSNLAIAVVEAGAEVTLLDAMIEGHGGNPFNIEPVADRVKTSLCDIRDVERVREAVQGQDYIFHLAGQNDHVLSLTDPFPDIDINIKGTAVLLEACRHENPTARLVYTGTRGEYGPAAKLPVSEDAPINPKGIYELSSLTAQQLFRIYHENHRVRSVTLRLTNIYGERAQMRHDRFGVANWFVRLALDDQTIPIYGDGSLLRDFVHVKDAVRAILAASLTEAAFGGLFNVGNDRAASFREFAEAVVRIAGSGRLEFTPFSKERAAVEPGDFYSDITKIRTQVGWSPQVGLDEGIGRTVEYYRRYGEHYW